MSSTLIMIDANFPTKKSLFFFVPGVASDQPNESEIALGLSEDMLMDCGTPEPVTTGFTCHGQSGNEGHFCVQHLGMTFLTDKLNLNGRITVKSSTESFNA